MGASACLAARSSGTSLAGLLPWLPASLCPGPALLPLVVQVGGPSGASAAPSLATLMYVSAAPFIWLSLSVQRHGSLSRRRVARLQLSSRRSRLRRTPCTASSAGSSRRSLARDAIAKAAAERIFPSPPSRLSPLPCPSRGPLQSPPFVQSPSRPTPLYVERHLKVSCGGRFSSFQAVSRSVSASC